MREKKSEGKRGTKKAAKKVAVKTKITAKKTPAKKMAKKGGAEIKKKKTKKRIAPKETKKIKAKVKKKVAKKPVKKETKRIKAKIKVKKEVKAKKVAKKIEKKIEVKKVIKKPYPPLPMGIIPEEYGEDALALMTVDPRKLFVYWEVSKDSLAEHKGDITIRLYDVTGVDFDGMNANSYLDLTVDKRIGDLYLDVKPGRDYIADIGVKDHLGIFISIVRSNKATTPCEGRAEKGIFPQKLYETGLPKGFPFGYDK